MRKPNSPRIVVIGAGIGGLCAAVRLAAKGCDVTVIDAHATPGGKMRTLPSAAGPVDAGPTVLTLRHVLDDVFAAAGTALDDHLTLLPQPLLARHWWQDGSSLDLHADMDASAAAIAAFAGPQAEADFRRFNRLSASLYAAFDAPMMQAPRPLMARIALNALAHPTAWPALLPGRTLTQQLARSFHDPRLRQLFGRYATYVGGLPDYSPAVLSLIWRAEAQGVWAVKGGMHTLARALADLATAKGAAFQYGVTARKVESRGGQVTAVALSDGQTVKCDAVIFNGDPAALVAGLLGNGAQLALPATSANPRSLSAHVWTFAARPSGPDLALHNLFFASDPALEFGPIAAGQMSTESTLYICAQDRQSPARPTGPERFQIILNAAPKSTSGDLDQCRTRTFPRLARFGLTFDQTPPDQTCTPPSGFAALFPGSQGALYGRSPHGMLASFQRPGARTRLKGLYLAGGGAHPGAGVPMAALSGLHAAEAIWKDRALT
jgi:1-hydroxycarotenoid 3,4-desaturase